MAPARVTTGACVEGIDLSDGVSEEMFVQLNALLLEHHLLVLPDQDIFAFKLESFGRQRGDQLTHPTAGRHRDTDHVQRLAGRDVEFKFSQALIHLGAAGIQT